MDPSWPRPGCRPTSARAARPISPSGPPWPTPPASTQVEGVNFAYAIDETGAVPPSPGPARPGLRPGHRSGLPPRPSPPRPPVRADRPGPGPKIGGLSKNLAEDVCDRAAGNVCKGLRPLARSINTYFQNFFKSLKIRTAWRKDSFDTLRGLSHLRQPPFAFNHRLFSTRCRGGLYIRPSDAPSPNALRRGRCPHRPARYRHQKHHRRTPAEAGPGGHKAPPLREGREAGP